MNKNLPVPFRFDLGFGEFSEALWRQHQLEQEAFKSVAVEPEMARHWIRRIQEAPTDRIDRYGMATAMSLALAARITPEGLLELRDSAEAMAAYARIDPATFKARIAQFEQLDLIEVLERGGGNGRPHHIRLTILPDHHKEILQETRLRMHEHMQFQKERLSDFKANYRDTG